VVESRGKYLPGKDTPTFKGEGKPRCPYVTGRTGSTPAPASTGSSASGDDEPAGPAPQQIPAPPLQSLTAQSSAAVGLGPANSPGENSFLAELLAPTQGLAPADYPDWSSLLLGPTLRNTKVTLL
jgi:phospholipid/cholesterol/gamma-HCH transport system substrate-binding protein